MDIENLTKTQIVLLTLLVSFVTSIATGIVTITLMDQAPPAVTQTIHKVVERTIEKVVPAKTQTAIVSNKKEIVVVKEKNVIPDVIKKIRPAVVKIEKKEKDENKFVSLGFFVNDGGVIVTSNNDILKDGNYFIIVGEKEVKLEVLKINFEKQLAFLKVIYPKDKSLESSFSFVTFVDDNSLELGQPVLAINKINPVEISTGIITSLVNSESKKGNNKENNEITKKSEESKKKNLQNNEKSVKFLSKIKTNIPTDNLLNGTPLFDLKGNFVGLGREANNSFLAMTFIGNELKEVLLAEDLTN